MAEKVLKFGQTVRNIIKTLQFAQGRSTVEWLNDWMMGVRAIAILWHIYLLGILQNNIKIQQPGQQTPWNCVACLHGMEAYN